ncbi:hypothetical protein [Galactobacter caseinivorans]|uniref:Uncharacterized protein n=1 Tax=Galactobacter caseinivorans TaxID=2676123 RepID=A0A496PH87_9MICC|nr:hypothetical protein [Galactobacter caseinivorans]RKW69844.1 hypothetical protein DWQ67_10195 [Galactobacter caseinivorans]
MDNTWLWLVGGLVIALVGASAVLRRVRTNNAQLFSQEATAERAAQASARLSEPKHRLVNSYLAMGNLLAAAQEIRNATGQNARGALLDAQAMRLHPQPWKPEGLFEDVAPPVNGQGAEGQGKEGQGTDGRGATGQDESTPSGAETADPGTRTPKPEGEHTASGTPRGTGADPSPGPKNSPQSASTPAVASASTPAETRASDAHSEATYAHDSDHSAADADGQPSPDGPPAEPWARNDPEWTIPDSWGEVYGGDAGRGERHMEFTHHDGEDLHRFSTQDLPDSERDQLMSQLRDGDMASAADLIANRVGLDRDEVETALRSNHESGNDRMDGIAVRFDRGDGTAVEFSTQELPEGERQAFVEALKSGDLVSAAQVVSRHTGISQEQALSLLHAFRRRG